MIIIKKGDITEEVCDAIVNPANSFGEMGGGVALAIKRKGGIEIEEEAKRKSPIPVGKSIATTAGKLMCKYVIHSPTMDRPSTKIPLENVRLAVRSALGLAYKMKLKTISIPGMGTGTGGLNADRAAKVMVDEIKKFKNLEVRLIAFNSELYRSLIKYAGKL